MVGTIDSLERIAQTHGMVLIFLCQTAATREIVISDPLGNVIATKAATIFGLL